MKSVWVAPFSTPNPGNEVTSSTELTKELDTKLVALEKEVRLSINPVGTE